jgi:hypothetical protein
MNVKSLLLAAAVASIATGSAFANNYDNGAEFQVAQLSAPSQARSTTARTPSVEIMYQSRSDINPFVAVDKSDTRTRAEVRAETIRALQSGEARALRSAYAGSAK